MLEPTVRRLSPRGEPPAQRIAQPRRRGSVIAGLAVLPQTGRARLESGPVGGRLNFRWPPVLKSSGGCGPGSAGCSRSSGTRSQSTPATHSSAGRVPGVVAEPLPAYAPELNPADGVWRYIKTSRLPNLAPPDLAALREAVLRELDHVRGRPDLLPRLHAVHPVTNPNGPVSQGRPPNRLCLTTSTSRLCPQSVRSLSAVLSGTLPAIANDNILPLTLHSYCVGPLEASKLERIMQGILKKRYLTAAEVARRVARAKGSNKPYHRPRSGRWLSKGIVTPAGIIKLKPSYLAGQLHRHLWTSTNSCPTSRSRKPDLALSSFVGVAAAPAGEGDCHLMATVTIPKKYYGQCRSSSVLLNHNQVHDQMVAT